jgi:hypothetical protein
MRYALFHNLSWIPTDCVIDLKLLTSGNPTLSNEQNEIMLSTCLNIERGLKGYLLSKSSPREQPHTPPTPTLMFFFILCSFSIYAY